MRKPGDEGAPTAQALKDAQTNEDKSFQNPTGGLTKRGRDY